MESRGILIPCMASVDAAGTWMGRLNSSHVDVHESVVIEVHRRDMRYRHGSMVGIELEGRPCWSSWSSRYYGAE